MSELLRVEHLKKYFNTPAGVLHAVDDVSFSIEKGQTAGVTINSGFSASARAMPIRWRRPPSSSWG